MLGEAARAARRTLWVAPRDRQPPAVAGELVHVDAAAAEAPAGIGPSTFDVAVCDELEIAALAHWLPALRAALTSDGTLVVGCAHADSRAHALAALAADRRGGPHGGCSLSMLVATLAAAGFVVARALRVGDAIAVSDAALDPDALGVTPPDPRTDYFVVSAHGGDRREATARARRMLAPRSTAATADEALAHAALLRREQHLAALEGSLGWRVLSHYGPYKRRYVLPAWRSLRSVARHWLRDTAAPAPSPYEAWTRFAERVHHACATAAATEEPAVVAVDVVMVLDGATLPVVRRAVAALPAQDHRDWQLWITAVGEAGAAIARTLDVRDSRVHVDPGPFPTAAAAADAAVTRGRAELVVLCSDGVQLDPGALSAVAVAFRDADAAVVYADDDQIDDEGRRHAPRLKPGWSPDLLLSSFYWSGAIGYRRALLARIGGFRAEYGGAHHYDLALRASEARARIVHVPRLLAHATAPPTASGGPADLASREAGRRALAAALERRGIAGEVQWRDGGDGYRVRRSLAHPGAVTIVVPTRDGGAMLERCVRAVEATDHPSLQLVLVDNGSVDPATLAFLRGTRHTVIRAPGPFNFSRLNNGAVAATQGEYLVFLNDDTEARSPQWLRALAEHAQRPEVGAVGAKLLYPDGRIQHAGIALGIGGLAGHPHRFQHDVPDAVRNVSAVTAACLMMRRASFEAVGGFDERLPVNSNDVDLCLRLRARGQLIVYTPDAVLTHHESATRGARAVPDDAWLMTRRWRRELADDPYYNPNADRREETGAIDLTKPDGMVCLYAVAERRRTIVTAGADASVGQRFFATGADLCAIVVRVGDAGDATGLRLRLRTDPESASDVRVVERSVAGRTADERWFCFAPVAESADRFWYFALEHADGRAVAVMRTPIVSDVMGPSFEDHRPSSGMLVFELYARAPLRSGVA